MKKIFFLLFMFLSIMGYSQTDQFQPDGGLPHCGMDLLLNSLKQKNPEIISKLEQMDRDVSLFAKSNLNKTSNSNSDNITIPVVVYVVHNNGVENISDDQILSQINKLNEYFLDYGFRFCMATANGSSSLPGSTDNPGIIRIANASLTDFDTDLEYEALTATSNLPSNRYLRIWVVKSINNGSVSGISILPDVVPPNLDGVIMSYNAFGDSASCGCNTLANASQYGKILVHEVGHYLGLYHTFHNSCSGMTIADCETNGDKVCDTPPVSSANAGCNFINSCVEPSDLPDDISNYMDYTNEVCVNHFTAGQVERMIAMVTMHKPMLISSQNQIHTGITCNGGLLASFTADSNSPCVGLPVTFTAAPIPGVTSYTWDFGDGNIGSGQMVTHSYATTLNPAVVSLTISNGTNSATTIQTYYIESCTTINNSESNWYFYNKNAITFSSGTPVYNDSAFLNATFWQSLSGSCETSAVQNSNNGELLFYTNGVQVWDKSHQQINPTNLLHGNYTSQNGVIIVPDPVNSSQYYIFTSDLAAANNSPYTRGYKYSKVQVNGTVVSLVAGQVNIPMAVPVSGYRISPTSSAIITDEALTAIRKSDGYWIVASASKNQNSCYIILFNLNSSGLAFHSETLVDTFSSTIPYNLRNSNIQVSPNAKRVAFSNPYGGNIYNYNFDVCTGVLSNRRSIPVNLGVVNNTLPWSFEFSPDSRFLYGLISVPFLNGQSSSSYIVQYDLDPCNISPVIVSENINTNLSAIQRGPNGKLYINVSGTPNISVINNPNNLCTITNPNACNYNPNGVVMQNNTTVGSSLPNMIDANNVPAFTNTMLYSQANCSTECYVYNFEADICTTSYLWDFGDFSSGSINNTSTLRTPIHSFTGPGTYRVTCTTPSGIMRRNVVVGAVPIIVGNSTVCPQNNLTGSYTVEIPSGYSAHWSATGGTISGLDSQSNVIVNWSASGGVITVVLTNNFNNCTSTASKTITIANVNTTFSDDTFCFSSGDYSTTHSVTIPPGYTALWTIENGVVGTITTPNNQANVGVTWSSGFGYLGLTLTNPNGCTFKSFRTIHDQCVCNCLNTMYFTYTQTQSKTATFQRLNSVSGCNSVGGGRFDYGDGTFGYSTTHTYATAGTYTVVMTPVLLGAFDEAICSGTPYTMSVTVTEPVRQTKQSLDNQIIIYPNPASSLLNFNVSVTNSGVVETVVKSIDGKELLRKKWDLETGRHDLQLELPNNISDGMIFVEIVSDEIKETRTIIIKK